MRAETRWRLNGAVEALTIDVGPVSYAIIGMTYSYRVARKTSEVLKLLPGSLTRAATRRSPPGTSR